MSGARSIPIAVLASGRGSNFGAIHRAIAAGELDARIVGVLSDQPEARVLESARALGIPAACVPVPPKSGDGAARRARHEAALLEQLRAWGPSFLVLAGYMRILGPTLIEAYRSPRGYSRIVNIHPSLLPSFPGLDAYRQAFDAGVKLAGATVHLVDETLDGGPICAQRAFPIDDCATAEDVERRGLELEHRLYSETLKWVLPESFDLEIQPRRIRVRSN